MNKTIPRKRYAKRQNGCLRRPYKELKKRREAKGKGEKERYTFPKGNIFECRVPKIARRDKKAFLSDQCKEIEENNRIGKTRDLIKKIRYTKGTFHANMGQKWYGPNRSRRY